MKADKRILIAFILNITFSVFEIIGGIFTNSISIISDAIHDFGDAISIGISYFLERKSKGEPDEGYTYGYARYSILGAFITTSILFIGSSFVIYNAIKRMINPISINYDGMIIFAILGVLINFLAVYFTRDGKSLNQKAVNLHMLEDVLGWLIVLIGAIIIRFTKIDIIDSIMSIGVAIFILIHAFKHFKTILSLFLEKVPEDISLKEIRKHLLKIDGVIDVHHIHIWSLDGINNYATMHVVVDNKNSHIKEKIKEKLYEFGIAHTTIELEFKDEICNDKKCKVNDICVHHHHHH